MNKSEQTTSAAGNSKVVLPSFLDHQSPFYATDFFSAFFYISMILLDHEFTAGENFLKVDELEPVMNKITVEGYKNEKLPVADVATNKRMVKIVTKYDPHLACWHNCLGTCNTLHHSRRFST